MTLKVLHIAYSLNDISAATRLARAQDLDTKTFFFLGRVSKSIFVRNRQIYPYLGAILGISLHILNKILSIISGINEKEIFSFDITTVLQSLIIKRIIRNIKIDIIHIHWGGYGFFPLNSIKDINLPVLITAHDYHFFTGGCHIPMDCPQYTSNCKNCPMAKSFTGKKIVEYNRNYKNNILKKINPIVIAPSSYTAGRINQVHPYLNIFTIGNTAGELYENISFDYDGYNVYRNLKKVPTLITVGANKTNRNNKGQDILESVITQLNDLNIKFNYISIGKYEYYQGPLERIHFDSIEPQELIALYSMSDLCLVTSRYETFSQVTLESICSGTPVVAFNISGPKDIIINGKNGFLVNSFDVDSFLNTIIDNMNYKLENLYNLPDIAKTTSNNFSPVEIKSKYQIIYQYAINNRL